MTEVPINQRTGPKYTVEIKLKDLTEPECFGEYTTWPCDGYGKNGPCRFVTRCKKAKNETVFMT